MSFRHLLAIDPSLTCSGWALFQVESGKILGIGKVKSRPPRVPLSERFLDLHNQVQSLLNQLKLSESDILVCEAETSMKDPKAAHKIEQVRGIFETIARSKQITVPGRVNPRSVHAEILGHTGRQLPRLMIKEMARRTVATLFETQLASMGFSTEEEQLKKHQDIVDAVLLGHLAVNKIQFHSFVDGPLDFLFSGNSNRRSWIPR